MISRLDQAPACVELLLFTAGGIRFGVECSSIAGILTLPEAQEIGLSILDLPAALRLACLQEPVCAASRVIVLKGGDASTGVIINGPDEFFMADAADVSPLPALLSATISTPAIRGVARRGDEFILLADFQRALLTKACA